MNSGINNEASSRFDSKRPPLQAKKVVIIGGSAAGAGVAAKLRRLDEHAQIIIIDRASVLSYANCGIPYHVGNVIKDPDDMYSLSEGDFKDILNVDVRLEHEVLKLNRDKKTLLVKNINSGQTFDESYDKLVFAGGSKIRQPDFVVSDAAAVFYLNNHADSEAVKRHLTMHHCEQALIIGAGFIGLESAENFHRLGMQVSIVEKADQVLSKWDSEMAAVVKSHLLDRGVHLYLEEHVEQINNKTVILGSGKILHADIVIVAAGSMPNVELAKSSGLAVGEHGGLLVNQFLETQDPNVFALGDAIEVPDHLLGNFNWLPFAGPAHKQARVVAENMFGKKLEYQTPHISAIVKVFSLSAAMTGYSEKQLISQRIAYEKVYTESPSHASFYPGSHSMMIKLLFTPEQGRILGAQIIGSAGVDKRIDILATAMQAQMRVSQLAALDLSYAPPFSSAKDPVNVAGMVAHNVLRHKVQQIHWNELDMSLLSGSIMLDVRSADEFHMRALPGAINIPLEKLRQRIHELPKNEDIVVYCSYGKKGYFAYQMLLQYGFTRVKTLAGGITVYSMAKMHKQQMVAKPHAKSRPETSQATPSRKSSDVALEIDASGLSCPGPIMKLAKAMSTVHQGDIVKITATDFTFVSDVKTWCQRKGHQLLSIDDQDSQISVMLQKTS